jgi:hypothetical protein
MRITTSIAQQSPKAIIEHKGKVVEFQVSVFGKGAMIEEGDDDGLSNDVFHYLNFYWSQLDDPVQDGIFQVYENVREIINSSYTVGDMNENLSKAVAELLSYHKLSEVQMWLSFSSGVMVPQTFLPEYVPNMDNNSTREKTYTRSDYLELVALSLALRSMIPIWGEYISSTRRSYGNYYKEFHAYMLLKYSEINNSLAVQKLRTYISNLMNQSKDDSEKLMNVLSTEDYPQWLLSLTVVKKLCIGDISGNNPKDPKQDIVKYLYKFLMQRIRSPDADHANRIQKNKLDDIGRENKGTVLERYRMKTNLSLGEVVELEYSVEDLPYVATRLTSLMTEDIFNSAQRTCQLLQPHQVTDVQVLLLSWVMKPVISPRGISYLNRDIIIQLLGVLQSVLWARGHKYLSLLVTSYPRYSNDEYVLAPQSSKDRIPKELSDKIELLYPFSKPIGRVSTGKVSNYALEAVDQVVADLVSHSWVPTAEDRWLRETLGNTSRVFVIKPDIRSDLAKLLIELGERNWL